MDGPAGLLRLHHVALPFPGTAEAADDARRFYTDVLGLGELPVPEILAADVIWFAAGDQEVHLYAEPSGVSVNRESTRHPCFRVADLSAVRERLAGLGVETIDGLPEVPGRPRFFVRDPFGNALEFLELTQADGGDA